MEIQYFVFFISYFRNHWDSAPLSIILSNAPVDQTVDYPAITICNSFATDRWGFLRDLLNHAKFLCNGEQDCQDTVKLRELLKGSSPIEGPDYLSTHFVFNFAKIMDSWLVQEDSEDYDSFNIPMLKTTFGNIMMSWFHFKNCSKKM